MGFDQNQKEYSKYSKAINCALSHTFRNNTVVVSDRSAGSNFIRYAKSQRLLSVNCEILSVGSTNSNKTNGYSVVSDMLQGSGASRPMLDGLHALIERKGSNIIVVDTIDEAKMVSKKMKNFTVVSHNGTIFKPNGEISKSNIYGSQFTVNHHVERSSDSFETVNLDQLENQIKLNQTHVSDLSTKLEVLHSDLLIVQNQLTVLKSSIKEAVERQNSISISLNNYAKDSYSMDNEIERLIKTEVDLQSSLETLLSSEMDPDWNRYIDLKITAQSLLQDKRKVSMEKNELESQMSSLKSSLADGLTALDKCSNELSSLKDRKTTLQQECTQLREDLTNMTDQLKEAEQEISDLEESLSNKKSRFTKISESVIETQKQLTTKGRLIQIQQFELDKLGEEISRINDQLTQTSNSVGSVKLSNDNKKLLHKLTKQLKNKKHEDADKLFEQVQMQEAVLLNLGTQVDKRH
ncbi:hypothetical protein GEMRC1_002067 [Eukaryota sp. GEM-RC1]